VPPVPKAPVIVEEGEGAAGAGGLSKKKEKRRLARKAREERKGEKKNQKHANALASALTTLSKALPAVEDSVVNDNNDDDEENGKLRARLCAAFSVKPRYRSLPMAFGAQTEEGHKLLQTVLLRPAKYDAKFLPQEYSLLHKLWSVLGGDCLKAGVVDVGAGNANCAVLAAALLGVTVICVERESPREELRAEMQLPPELRPRVIRYESDIEDFDTKQLKEVAGQFGLERIVLMAKHPCGIGVDRSIDCVQRLKRGSVEVVASIIATCCCNKLTADDNTESRVREYCTFYEQDVPAHFRGEQGQQNLERAVETLSRCSAWRTTAKSLGNGVLEEQLEWAELFEDSIQSFRLRRLEDIFGASAEIRFAPSQCTLQDRCLVSVQGTELPAGVFAHESTQDPAFMQQLRKAAEELLKISGPLDCRPRGLKSAKFGFDYTEDVYMEPTSD